MKNYVHIINIVTCVGLIICLGSCRAKRTVANTTEHFQKVERIESHQDSIRNEQSTKETELHRRNEVDISYIRITEYDSVGNVQKVQEEWRDKRTVNTSERESKSESTTSIDSETLIIESDSISSTAVVNEQISTDSRPIQGIEWLWVIIGLAMAAIIVIYFVIKKRK